MTNFPSYIQREEDSVSGIYTDSVSGMYTDQGTDSVSGLYADSASGKVTYGYDGGELVMDEFSADESYSMTDFSTDQPIESPSGEESSFAMSDGFSIFAQSYANIMRDLANFTPKMPRSSPINREKAATSSSIQTKQQESTDSSDDASLDLEDQRTHAKLPDTISYTSGKTNGTMKSRLLSVKVVIPFFVICFALGVGGWLISRNKLASDSSPEMVANPTVDTDAPISTENDENEESHHVPESTIIPEQLKDEPDDLVSTEHEETGGCEENLLAVSCAAHFEKGCTSSGLQWILPEEEAQPVQVYCDQTTDMLGNTGGWTLFLSVQMNTTLVFSQPVLPSSTGALNDQSWQSLRDSMRSGIMAVDENGDRAFISVDKLAQANCWTPWDIPTLVPRAESSFPGLSFSQDDNKAIAKMAYSLFRTEKGSCDLVGDDFCALQVSTTNNSNSSTSGSGPYSRCDDQIDWDVPPSASWSYQRKVLYYLR